MTGCQAGTGSAGSGLNLFQPGNLTIKISIQAPVSCILRASTKSPNSITAFLGPSFLTVSELFRFSSFQRKLAAPWLAAMFETLDQPLTVLQAVSYVCALADQQPVRFRGYVLLARSRAHPRINTGSPDSDTKWDEKHPCAELDSFVVTLLAQNPSK